MLARKGVDSLNFRVKFLNTLYVGEPARRDGHHQRGHHRARGDRAQGPVEDGSCGRGPQHCTGTY